MRTDQIILYTLCDGLGRKVRRGPSVVQDISDEATLKSCPKEVKETALQRIGRQGLRQKEEHP